MRDKGEGAKGGTLGGQKEPENLTIATSRAHNTTHTSRKHEQCGQSGVFGRRLFWTGSTGGEEILKHYSQTRAGFSCLSIYCHMVSWFDLIFYDSRKNGYQTWILRQTARKVSPVQVQSRA